MQHGRLAVVASILTFSLNGVAETTLSQASQVVRVVISVIVSVAINALDMDCQDVQVIANVVMK